MALSLARSGSSIESGPPSAAEIALLNALWESTQSIGTRLGTRPIKSTPICLPVASKPVRLQIEGEKLAPLAVYLRENVLGTKDQLCYKRFDTFSREERCLVLTWLIALAERCIQANQSDEEAFRHLTVALTSLQEDTALREQLLDPTLLGNRVFALLQCSQALSTLKEKPAEDKKDDGSVNKFKQSMSVLVEKTACIGIAAQGARQSLVDIAFVREVHAVVCQLMSPTPRRRSTFASAAAIFSPSQRMPMPENPQIKACVVSLETQPTPLLFADWCELLILLHISLGDEVTTQHHRSLTELLLVLLPDGKKQLSSTQILMLFTTLNAITLNLLYFNRDGTDGLRYLAAKEPKDRSALTELKIKVKHRPFALNSVAQLLESLPPDLTNALDKVSGSAPEIETDLSPLFELTKLLGKAIQRCSEPKPGVIILLPYLIYMLTELSDCIPRGAAAVLAQLQQQLRTRLTGFQQKLAADSRIAAEAEVGEAVDDLIIRGLQTMLESSALTPRETKRRSTTVFEAPSSPSMKP